LLVAGVLLFFSSHQKRIYALTLGIQMENGRGISGILEVISGAGFFHDFSPSGITARHDRFINMRRLVVSAGNSSRRAYTSVHKTLPKPLQDVLRLSSPLLQKQVS